jgi:hypothetical protein
MSLRKPFMLTPARIEANRRDAQKSTGPRTARGKVWSGINAGRDGGRSPLDQSPASPVLCPAACGGQSGEVADYNFALENKG